MFHILLNDVVFLDILMNKYKYLQENCKLLLLSERSLCNYMPIPFDILLLLMKYDKFSDTDIINNFELCHSDIEIQKYLCHFKHIDFNKSIMKLIIQNTECLSFKLLFNEKYTKFLLNEDNLYMIYKTIFHNINILGKRKYTVFEILDKIVQKCGFDFCYKVIVKNDLELFKLFKENKTNNHFRFDEIYYHVNLWLYQNIKEYLPYYDETITLESANFF